MEAVNIRGDMVSYRVDLKRKASEPADFGM